MLTHKTSLQGMLISLILSPCMQDKWKF